MRAAPPPAAAPHRASAWAHGGGGGPDGGPAPAAGGPPRWPPKCGAACRRVGDGGRSCEWRRSASREWRRSAARCDAGLRERRIAARHHELADLPTAEWQDHRYQYGAIGGSGAGGRGQKSSADL